MKSGLYFIVIILSLLAAGCATVRHELTLAELDDAVPVSASKSLYIDGQVIDGSELEVVEEFSFEKVVKAPIKYKKPVLYLNKDIAEIIARTDAQAVSELKIEIEKIQSGALTWIYMGEYAGLLALGGVAFQLFMSGYINGGDVQLSEDNIITMSALGGAGLALIGVSVYMQFNAKIKYKLRVSGKAVNIR